MLDNTFLRRSQQLASFRVAVTLIALGTLVMPIAPRIHDWVPIYLTFPFAIVSTLGGTVWLCTRIRCPQCGIRIVWDALRGMSPEGFAAALSGDACPRCGHRP
jgi:hypothetical protein